MDRFTDKEFKLYKDISFQTENKLKKILLNTLKKVNYNPVEGNNYIYAEGEIPVALCAHMDTVFPAPPTDDRIFYDRSKNVIWSPDGLGADDRAGIYIIMDIIKSGLRPHIIFTCGEEIGGVGAMDLANIKCPFKDLKYIIQLDRQGTSDCVFYDCNNIEFIDYIESFGFIEHWGSFSDISIICPSWQIAGVNLSVGYFMEHTKQETLCVNALKATIKKVKKLLSEKDIKFYRYVPMPYKTYYYPYIQGQKHKCKKCGKNFNEEDLFPVKDINHSISYYCPDCIDEKIGWCNYCGEPFEIIENESHCICNDCLNELNGDITYNV